MREAAHALASVSAALLAVSVCATMVLTLLFTYSTCVLQSQCPPLPQLPTVGDTWTHPPGSFVSREAVSTVALFLFLLQYVLWLPEQQAFAHARKCMQLGMCKLRHRRKPYQHESRVISPLSFTTRCVCMCTKSWTASAISLHVQDAAWRPASPHAAQSDSMNR